MPEVNNVPIKYEPVCGDLYLDSFRGTFYTERLDDIKDTLKYLCYCHSVIREVEATIHFCDTPDDPPEVYDFRYYSPTVRRKHGKPFSGDSVTLWPKNND